MRIISKFHNYYDNANPYYDASTVWVREERRIELYDGCGELPYEILDRFLRIGNGLCKTFEGCVYSVIFGIGGELKLFFLRKETFDKKARVTDKLSGLIKTKDDKYRSRFPFWFRNQDDKYFEQASNELLNFDPTDLFVELNSPLFMMAKKWSGERRAYVYELVVNPDLQKIPLQHVIDPFTMYTSIENFFNNVLVARGLEMPDFGDDIKRDMHGMDEWSFKKPPTKRR